MVRWIQSIHEIEQRLKTTHLSKLITRLLGLDRVKRALHNWTIWMNPFTYGNLVDGGLTLPSGTNLAELGKTG